MTTTNTPDTLAINVRDAQVRHVAGIKRKASEAELTALYLEVLRAERALEVDCLAKCTNPRTAGIYRAAIADYDARIEDEIALLASL